MRDEDKTREQLLSDLADFRKRFNAMEASCIDYKESADSLQFFEKALETMQLGVTISDLKGNILYINSAELDMHGYTTEEVCDKTVRTFAPTSEWNPMTAEQITSMKRWARESINTNKDGRIFPVRLMSDVIKNAEGLPVGIVTTCEDISARKKMEDDIKGKIKELEEFYEMAVNRELKMRELKKEIKKLKKALVNTTQDAH